MGFKDSVVLTLIFPLVSNFSNCSRCLIVLFVLSTISAIVVVSMLISSINLLCHHIPYVFSIRFPHFPFHNGVLFIKTSLPVENIFYNTITLPLQKSSEVQGWSLST